MANLKEIAELAGVSPSTVSHALHNTAPISQEVRARVLEIAKKLGYVPRRKPGAMKNAIGFVTDAIDAPFVPRMAAGVVSYAGEKGYAVLLMQTDLEQKLSSPLLKGRVRGIIVGSRRVRRIAGPAEADLPLVFCYCYSERLPHAAVVPDDFKGGFLATNHLIRLGHRRIGFIGGIPTWKASADRLSGYMFALSEHGLACDEVLILHGDWEIPSGYRAAKALLSLPNPPTAIFANNDLMAIGALDAAKEVGLRVPEDVAIVGYDDREVATCVRPRLTTIRLPLYEMGRSATEILFRNILEGRMINQRIQLEPELVIRESCGGTAMSNRLGRQEAEQLKNHG